MIEKHVDAYRAGVYCSPPHLMGISRICWALARRVQTSERRAFLQRRGFVGARPRPTYGPPRSRG
jgi:hypothetical protein